MGRSHRANVSTFARLATLGFVDKADIFYAVKAICCAQRLRPRDDRKQSRLKYLIHSWGVEKFQSVVEQYMGKSFQPSPTCPLHHAHLPRLERAGRR